MSTITSFGYVNSSHTFFSFSTDNGYVCNIPIINNQEDVVAFNKKFHGDKPQKNCNFILNNDFISKIILYPCDGTLQSLLIQRDKTNSSEITIATLDNQLVDTLKLLHYCDKIQWNPNEMGSEKIGCKQLNAIHIYDVEAGAVTQNFISNGVLDFQWDKDNENLIYTGDNYGLISIHDLRQLNETKFGQKVNKCKKSQIEILDNFIFITTTLGDCNIYDIRNQKIVTNFKLKSQYTPKDCLPISNKHINCPIFKVKYINNLYTYVYLYGTDFVVRKFLKSMENSEEEEKLIQTRHVYSINDFHFHPTLALLTSVSDRMDVCNLY
uniref:WD_REPEATS_REGION domain-containing protein n=1 Tax=Strongyloides papillosus TaxID=174720 RepID=A0A0N5C191_STREA